MTTWSRRRCSRSSTPIANGGVLGAWKRLSARQDSRESLFYERRKHDGTYPIIGVNTFRNPAADRSGDGRDGGSHGAEKQSQLKRLKSFHETPQCRAAPLTVERAARGLAKDNTLEVLRTLERLFDSGVGGGRGEIPPPTLYESAGATTPPTCNHAEEGDMHEYQAPPDPPPPPPPPPHPPLANEAFGAYPFPFLLCVFPFPPLSPSSFFFFSCRFARLVCISVLASLPVR